MEWHSHVRHWNSTVMWDYNNQTWSRMWDGTIQPKGLPVHVQNEACQISDQRKPECWIISSYIVDHHWFFALFVILSVNICGISQPSETLEFHNRMKHWNSTAIWDTGISQLYETLEFLCYLRHWNSTAIRDTGIPQQCETLEFHKHVRHWNFETIWDTEISQPYGLL
jgi:hypothetical protein